MIIAITGTPGTGKTSVAKKLVREGYIVLDLNRIACENDFLLGRDEKRKSNIVDIDKLNLFIKKNYSKFDIVFVEGHLSHLLKCVDKLIILRLEPSQLEKYLKKKRWNEKKIKENLESEILDIVLCESIEIHSKDNMAELNVTNKSVDEIVSIIIDLEKDGFKNLQKYKIGNIDWSEEILKDF
jgi:adenylate kinase